MYGEENPNPLLSSFELVFMENERFFLAEFLVEMDKQRK